jgi:putative ABC transport system permease protein
MRPHPPRRALNFLRWFCREDFLDEIEGDLTELFEKQYENSPGKAKRQFIWTVVRYFRPAFMKAFKNNKLFTMSLLRHNALIMFRNNARYKTSFVLNLIGLSTGLTCAILIYLWVNDEITIDHFHNTKGHLYTVKQNYPLKDGTVNTIESAPGILAESLESDMPEVKEAVTVAQPMGGWGTKGIITSTKDHAKASELYVTANFFKAFSFQILHGDKKTTLNNPSTVLLSDELATKLFDRPEAALGKQIEWTRGNTKGQFQVSGIFKKPEDNSSLQFDLLFSYDLFFERHKDNLSNWGNSGPATYVVLHNDADVNLFQQKLKDYRIQKYKSAGGDPQYAWSIGELFIQPFEQSYLYNEYENGVQAGGRIENVRLFSVIAGFILLIACINFMNLSTARASRRTKEIGIKKAIGAQRSILLAQFLLESIFISVISLILSLLFVFLLLPYFNSLTEKQLFIPFTLNFLLTLTSIAIGTGVIAGSYPALFLASFKPVDILKGKLNISGGEWIRSGLVVFQFSISIILIVSVIIVYKQIEFINTKDLGYNRDSIIQIAREGNLDDGAQTFITEAKRIPGVQDASSFGHNLVGEHGGTGGVSWEGKTPEAKINFGNLEVDLGLIEMLDIEMAQGRTFSPEFSDEQSKIIFNEAAISAMGLKDPVGKTISLWGQEKQIIGVARNFHFESFYTEVKPCFMRYATNNRYILIKIAPENKPETLARIEEFYRSFNDGLSFDYTFLDDDYEKLYAAENRIAVLSRYFAGVAILISCLGLFGLTAFMAERRFKEVGIRKILGASRIGIVGLLSSDLTKLVVVAIALSLPVSYFIAEIWLDGFVYRIEMQWWFFFGAGIVALITAWLTVGFQTLKAASVNPIETLKIE